MSIAEDLRGRKFGRLTVIERSERKDPNATWWVCKCDCGNTKEVRAGVLKKGETRSCGCLNRELAGRRGRDQFTKHGFYGTRIYNIWTGMKDRCYSEKCPQYKHYGGRGIRLCEEWANNPKNFCEWAMANGYKENLTIDRIDCNGDYSPNNCRWVTMDEQQRNKRNNRNITYNGKTQCVAAWARELGISHGTLFTRIYAGWTNPQEILFGR